MQTQQDTEVRMLALANLVAMCDRQSGHCHRYTVSKVTRSRVHVEYSNPDEYGHESPMTAVFPCLPSDWPGDSENPRVIMTLLRVIGDNWHTEGWQAFTPLMDCPQLWRHPDTMEWQTREEIEAK